MVGGAYLCFEGFEELAHKFPRHGAEDEAHHQQLVRSAGRSAGGPWPSSARRSRGAIRTDFILSAEIIVIALGSGGQRFAAATVGRAGGGVGGNDGGRLASWPAS